MNYYIYRSPASELYHYGIDGQKWGVRRFQNSDGTLTKQGKKRYNLNGSEVINKLGSKREKLKKKFAETYTEENMKYGLRDKKGRVIMDPEQLEDQRRADLAALGRLDDRHDRVIQRAETEVKRKETTSDVKSITSDYKSARGKLSKEDEAVRKFVLGKYGSETYDMLRATGHGKAESFLRARLDFKITAPGFGKESIQRRLLYDTELHKRRQIGY